MKPRLSILVIGSSFFLATVRPGWTQDEVSMASPSPTPVHTMPELNGGFEGDDSLGYGYLGGNLSFRTDDQDGWGLRADVSYLRYTFHDADGHQTTTSGPGFFGGTYYRRATAHTFALLGAGYDVRFSTSDSNTSPSVHQTQQGLAFQAFGLWDPDSRSYIMAFGSYSTSGDYSWCRVSFMQRISDHPTGTRAWSVGVEVTGQGNKDVLGYGAGVVAELAEIPDRFGVLRFSVGYAKRQYTMGPDDDRVYAGISFYRNLRPRP